MADIKNKLGAGSPVTLMSTELDSLASSTGTALSASLDPGLNLLVDLFLDVTFGAAPTADTVVECWMIRSDGTNFEDGSSSTIVPTHGFLGNFVMRNVVANKRVIPNVVLPATNYKLQIVNKTNQNFPASGSTIKAIPSLLQVV